MNTTVRPGKYSTKRAALPAISLAGVRDQPTRQVLSAMQERLELLGGERNPWEQAVTRRDMDAAMLGANGQVQIAWLQGAAAGSVVTVGAGGKPTVMSIQELIRKANEGLYQTSVYKDLVKRIDDPTRFDKLGPKVAALLLPDLSVIAAARGADIQRTEQRLQSAQESFAALTTEVTASVASNTAAVRQSMFAFADQNRATAGMATTITARLDDFDGGGATVEFVASALADRTDGLDAQVVWKVSAGGALAGIGLAATSSASGNATSAVIIRADRFAVVGSSYAGGPTLTPGAGNIPFSIDTLTGNVYMSANLLVGGTIFGGINLEITGSARLKGSYTGSFGAAALYANEAGGALNGVVGVSSAGGGIGLRGESTGTGINVGIGVSGTAAGSGDGVSGFSASGLGVIGQSSTGIGVFGVGGTYGVYSNGNAHVQGVLTVTGGITGNAATATYAASSGEVIHPTAANVTAVSGNASLRANNGNYVTAQQNDGNMVVYNFGSPIGSATGGFPSDARLKDRIAPTSQSGATIIKALEVVDYVWKAGTVHRARNKGRRITGFTAQQVANVLPELVSSNRGPDGDGDEVLLLNKIEMIPYLVKHNQELEARVGALEAA